jgi:hypothetical protein
MRALTLAVSLLVLVPRSSAGQAYSWPTPPPTVTAAGLEWQMRGEPVFFAGNWYYAAGPTIFFDGKVMYRSGVYQGVPLYVDATLEPYSIVYVPIGGTVMRPYERLREGELVGTVGSRTPSFPIQRDGDISVVSGQAYQTPYPSVNLEPTVVPEAVGTVGTRRPAAVVAPAPAPAPVVPAGPPPMGPRKGADVWITYEGVRWFNAGPAVTFDASRHLRVGEYHGFPVYRDAAVGGATIFVPNAPDGPVAPYTRR